MLYSTYKQWRKAMRSAEARELAKPLYRQRIVLAKKGKGSYNRKKQKETSND